MFKKPKPQKKQKKVYHKAGIVSDDEADQNIDISQLIRNLRISPEQRALEHQSALDTLEELRRAKEAISEESK